MTPANPKINEILRKHNCEQSFNKISQFKGEIAPIAEKSARNLKQKLKNPVNQEQRLHHFTIGHKFKLLDKEHIFQYKVDEVTTQKTPTKFQVLHSWQNEKGKDFVKSIQSVIENIRNVNSHYVHTFDCLKVDAIPASIIEFMKQAFELSAVHVFLLENSKSYSEYVENDRLKKNFCTFLFDKFYTFEKKANKVNDKEKEESERKYLEAREEFRRLDKRDALDVLLFVDVKENFVWKVGDTHEVFTTTKGRYLSYNACLFLLSLFLYKNEATQMISKIKGFKRNKTKEENSKRDIFTFLAKKFSSQDIDSEENHLVKFRDLVQYLNKYPVDWKSSLENEDECTEKVDALKSAIIDKEITRLFPDYAKIPRFVDFARRELWGKDIPDDFSDEEKNEFGYEIDTSIELKDAEKKLAEFEAMSDYKKRENGIREQNRAIKKIMDAGRNEHRGVAKLKDRLARGVFFQSYGRNQDRFLEFATRFLAEQQYFGADAKFRMQQFYTTEEQNKYLAEQKNVLSKKEFDKLPYHDAMLVHFDTYDKHKERYPSWDMPYVVADNAIQVKLTFAPDNVRVVSIQRALMVYLLEHALQLPEEKMAGAGFAFLQAYCQHHDSDFKEKHAQLQNGEIPMDEKADFKKLLPKRLLKAYFPQGEKTTEPSALQQLLDRAESAEMRYKALHDMHEQNNNLSEFEKRNKGKQFKLMFVRKAWNLMYFRKLYKMRVEEEIKRVGNIDKAHHKSFHITRDEFNDFCRYMFAFDEVPEYKILLVKMLQNKGFIRHNSLAIMLRDSKSLDDLYQATKPLFKKWMRTSAALRDKSQKYTLSSYQQIFDKSPLYINLSHFIEFIKNEKYIGLDDTGTRIIYKSLVNKKYLVGDYYIDSFRGKKDSATRKLINQLMTARLEDVMLYEIATRYLKHTPDVANQAKEHVAIIMTREVSFDVSDAHKKKLYRLTVPFNKLEKYVELMKHKEDQDEEYKSSYLANINTYIEEANTHKDMKAVYEAFCKDSPARILSFDGLHKIDCHIVSSSVKFTRVAMELEAYLIEKHKCSIKKDNRISTGEVPGMDAYMGAKNKNGEYMLRNKAFHFALPDLPYDTVLKQQEATFVTNEVKPRNPASYKSLDRKQKRVCELLLKTMHSNLFDRKRYKDDSTMMNEEAEKSYFNQVIRGSSAY